MVRPGDIGTISGLHVDAKFHLCLGSQAVDASETKPELAIQISEPIFVSLPVLGEVCGDTIDPSLDNYPTTTIGVHVTPRFHRNTWKVLQESPAIVVADITNLMNASEKKRPRLQKQTFLP